MNKIWIDIGKFDDYISGKKRLIIYANTIDCIWRIGVIV